MSTLLNSPRKLPTGDKPIMLMSIIPSCYNFKFGTDYARDYVQRHEVLAKEGIDLKFVTVSKRWWELERHHTASLLEEELPGSVIDIEDNDVYGYADAMDYVDGLSWPRDWFVALERRVYRNPALKRLATDAFSQLGYAPKFEFIDSPMGEGGLSVLASNLILYSGCQMLTSAAENIKKNGIITLPIPLPRPDCKNEAGLARKMYNYHLDTKLNLIIQKKGRGIVVNKDYYEIFGKIVDKLSDMIQGKLHIIEDDREIRGNAVNFITLPNNKVVVGHKFDKTAQFLEGILGSNSVIRFRTLPGECSIHGGLRCRTNIIPSLN